MTIDEAAEEGDEVFETDGVKIMIDNFSAMYLTGAEIDYTLMGGFLVRNPNAVASCACGHSFDAGGNEPTARGCGCGGLARLRPEVTTGGGEGNLGAARRVCALGAAAALDRIAAWMWMDALADRQTNHKERSEGIVSSSYR